MCQTWSELLFAHWPVPVEAMRALVPPELEVDTFENQAWVGVVPFYMSGVRLRWLPPFPTTSEFPELNLRTYVKHGGKTGVYFFSLEASSWLVVRGARTWYGLPYFDADMRCDVSEAVKYSSVRKKRRANAAEFQGEYRPDGPVFASQKGTLEHWLTERYALFTVDSRRRVNCGEIQHVPWPLQKAWARIEKNEIASASGIALPNREPHLLFVKKLDVILWGPRPVVA